MADPKLQLELAASRASLSAERTRFEEALDELTRALAVADRLAGAEDELTLRLRGVKSHVLFLAARYEQSAAMDRELLEIRRRQYGETHPEVARLYLRISASLGAQRRLDEARVPLLRAKELLEGSLGEGNALMIDVLNNLASVQLGRAEVPDAVALLERAAALSKERLGRDSPKTARIVANLGYAVNALDDLPRAATLYEEALASMARQGRAEHPDSINVRAKLALVQLTLGRVDLARTLAQEAVGLAERFGRPADLARSQLALGSAMLELGEPAKALPNLERAWQWMTSHEFNTPRVRSLSKINYGRALCEAKVDCARGTGLIRQAVAEAEAQPPITAELAPALRWSHAFLGRRR